MKLTSHLTYIYPPSSPHLQTDVIWSVFVVILVYDVSGGSGDRNCVVLNDIHIDIMDYILPASCTDSEFRQMWAEFEWENKVITAKKTTKQQEINKNKNNKKPLRQRMMK